MNKLIKDIQTEYEGNALNVYVSYEQLQKQTEQLNKAVNSLIEISEIKGLEDFQHAQIDILVHETTGKWISEITGLSWDEIKRINQ